MSPLGPDWATKSEATCVCANQATIPCTPSRIGPMKTKPTMAPLTRSLRAWAARKT